ncbi:hypothetical protein CF65_00788 [Aggregatibacter actinomycetemcomitans HK1651]|nr:hypothetical protein CF65_00788 [Aggregatibacter actinomycetemcomitans HK1651]
MKNNGADTNGYLVVSQVILCIFRRFSANSIRKNTAKNHRTFPFPLTFRDSRCFLFNALLFDTRIMPT